MGLEKSRNKRHRDVSTWCGGRDLDAAVRFVTEPVINHDGTVDPPQYRHPEVARRHILLDNGVGRSLRRRYHRADRRLARSICRAGR